MPGTSNNRHRNHPPIYWLVQSLEAHPDLISAKPRTSLLSPSELGRFRELKSERRRQEWLLGRWTIKQLLRELSETNVSSGTKLSWDAIVIKNDRNGAPYTSFCSPLTGHPFHISISHAHGYAFCAAVEGKRAFIGADLERIEARSARFVDDFFTPLEIDLLAEACELPKQARVTAIWSAKEATMKATRVGIGLNTQVVSCLLQPVRPHHSTWHSFEIIWHEAAESRPTLSGWWRIVDDFVLTLVSDPGRKPR